MYTKISQKQPDLTIFASDPQSAQLPLHPARYAGGDHSSANLTKMRTDVQTQGNAYGHIEVYTFRISPSWNAKNR